jgi:hypothetical protein
MRFVGQQCIQLHGGIGVTDEYIASHYFKRLTMLEMSLRRHAAPPGRGQRAHAGPPVGELAQARSSTHSPRATIMPVSSARSNEAVQAPSGRVHRVLPPDQRIPAPIMCAPSHG